VPLTPDPPTMFSYSNCFYVYRQAFLQKEGGLHTRKHV
jgi:hypothetical protein